LEWEHRV
jgi:hypothetical protein